MNLLHPGVRVGHTDPQSSSVTLPPHGSHSVAGGSLVPAFGGRGRPDLHLVGWGPGDGPRRLHTDFVGDTTASSRWSSPG